MIENFPVHIYFRTKNTTKRKEIHSNPIPPPTGGRFELSFEKNLSYFCRLLWEKIKKSAADKNFRKRNYFYAKKWPTKHLPGEGPILDLILDSPGPGGNTENPPTGGDILLHYTCVEGLLPLKKSKL